MIRYFRSTVFSLIALSLLMMPGLQVSAAQDETPEAECVTTTPEENEAIVTAYWDELVWANQGKIAEIVSPDEIHHWGIGIESIGLDAFTETFALFLAAFPDIRFDVNLVAAEGDLAASIWTATATQTGEWQGIAPTNKEVTWDGINIFRIECGQIVESWGEANHLGLLAQLGDPDLAAIPTALATEGTPTAESMATPCAEDSPEANIAVAARWTDEVWTGKDLDVLDEIANPAIVHHGAAFPDVHGVEELRQAIGRQIDVWPDITLKVDEAFADGDTVVVRWSGTGTNEGEFLGLPPTGQETTLSGINIYRLACGQIIEGWSELNGLSLLRQIQGEEEGSSATPAA